MTQAEEIKVELQALSEMRYQLLKAKEDTDESVEKALRAIKNETERLNQVKTQHQEKVSSCEIQLSACRTALASCLACVEDENTRCPPCDGEEAAVAQAETALRQAQQKLKQTVAHIANFQSLAAQATNALNSNKETAAANIESSRQALYDRINKALHYLKENQQANLDDPEWQVPLTPGQRSSHGSEYKRAKNRFIEEVATGDFENEPSHIQGWARQEVHRRETHYREDGRRDYRDYHSPPGHDVGHWIQNLNIPEAFHMENVDMNRYKGGKHGW